MSTDIVLGKLGLMTLMLIRTGALSDTEAKVTRTGVYPVRKDAIKMTNADETDSAFSSSWRPRMTSADAADPSGSRAYSAIWNVSNCDDLIRAVEDQFESWLRWKQRRNRGSRWDPATEVTGYSTGPDGQELLVVHHEVRTGHDLRLRLTEQNAAGTWRTTLTASTHATTSWVALHVDSDSGRAANVPKLADYLMKALELRDGQTWLSPKPKLITGHDVETFAEEITDIDRQGLYFVAATSGSDGISIGAFADKVAKWTIGTRGLAQVAVLDPDATSAFAKIVGPSHSVPPWTIRTFDVDVDPAIESDGRRHRILGTKRLNDPDGVVIGLLAGIARRHSATRPVPVRFSSVDRRLTRVEDASLVESVFKPARSANSKPVARPAAAETTQQPTVNRGIEEPNAAIADEAAEFLADVALVKEVLGIARIDRHSLMAVVDSARVGPAPAESIDRIRRQLEERRERISELELERDDLRGISDDRETQLSDLQLEQAKLSDKLRSLQRFVSQQGAPDVAYAEVEETKYPQGFNELFEMLNELKKGGVSFTGDRKIVIGLEEYDSLGRAAHTAWDCLLALCDYIRARKEGSHDSGIRDYLELVPAGYRGVSPGKFAARETSATMKNWGGERSFPVPKSVDTSGYVTMQAHLKLERIGMISPRMYYFDNYAKDGRIYVGYIGPHLTNTQTN